MPRRNFSTLRDYSPWYRRPDGTLMQGFWKSGRQCLKDVERRGFAENPFLLRDGYNVTFWEVRDAWS